jgi:hypothetical protein
LEKVSLSAAVSQYWPPSLMGGVSAAAVAFGITFIAEGKPGWWWIVVALGVLCGAGALVWTYRLQTGTPADEVRPQSESTLQQGAGLAQQSAVGADTSILINADNNSAAAWQIGTVNLGGRPDEPEPKRQ